MPYLTGFPHASSTILLLWSFSIEAARNSVDLSSNSEHVSLFTL